MQDVVHQMRTTALPILSPARRTWHQNKKFSIWLLTVLNCRSRKISNLIFFSHFTLLSDLHKAERERGPYHTRRVDSLYPRFSRPHTIAVSPDYQKKNTFFFSITLTHTCNEIFFQSHRRPDGSYDNISCPSIKRLLICPSHRPKGVNQPLS